MDMGRLLQRCIALERGAAEIYTVLATRSGNDGELERLWNALARDEEGHAHKLAAWRALVLAEAPERRPQADGFEEDVAELERLVGDARERARNVAGADEAFAIALGLERSELDAIYTTLLQASPMSRFPDFAETYRRETARHHLALVAAVTARPMTPENELSARLLVAAHRD